MPSGCSRPLWCVVLVCALSASAGAEMLQAPEPSPSPSPSPIPSPSPSVAPTEGSEEPIVVRDHRTVRSYPANLGHNVVEVWRKLSLIHI